MTAQEKHAPLALILVGSVLAATGWPTPAAGVATLALALALFGWLVYLGHRSTIRAAELADAAIARADALQQAKVATDAVALAERMAKLEQKVTFLASPERLAAAKKVLQGQWNE